MSRTGKRGFHIPFAVVVTLVLMIGAAVVIGTRFGMGGTITSTGDDVAAGGAQIANGPFRAVETTFRRATQMWDATARIEELQRENRDLRVWRVLAERLAERNARYEALLRLPRDAYGADSDLDSAIGAQLVLDSGGPFTRTLVANAGAEHGVRIGYVAVNENGLVGRVVSVGRRSARVLLLDDYNSRIPVMGAQSRARAVLAGQAAQPPDLITRPFQMDSPRLEYASQGLRNGEPVITSGDGGVLPRGIRVGTARQGRDGVWRVALAASQQPIDFVRLIPYARPDAPERSGEVETQGPPLPAPARVAPEAPAGIAAQQAAPRRAIPASTPPPTPAAQAETAPAPAAAAPTANGTPQEAPPSGAPPTGATQR